jgi:hypothetical protein
MKTGKSVQFNLASSLRAEGWSTVRAVLCLVLCILGAGIVAMAQSPRIIEFDAPGAGSTPDSGFGTQGGDINPEGAIVGMFSDTNNVMHGFVRTYHDRLTTFDAPGAGSVGNLYFKLTPAGVLGGQGTYPFSMNPEGTITGFYFDENTVGHGFVRTYDGRFTSFDDPDAGTISPQVTAALNINSAGMIAGNYFDANSVRHGFVRTPDGKFINFDPPDSVFSFVCVAMCLNQRGEITGDFLTNDGVSHGFVRAPDGRITTFDVPGAGTDGSQGQGTFVASINAEGAATGSYTTGDNVNHGFMRSPDGRIATFDVPGAGTDGSQAQGTYAEAINAEGVVTGQYIDLNDVNHGFVRTPNGRFIYFDAPGAGSDPGSYEGTIPLAINAEGEITGAYIDSKWVLHAFVRFAGPAECR